MKKPVCIVVSICMGLFLCVGNAHADNNQPATAKPSAFDRWYPLLNFHTTITSLIKYPIDQAIIFLEKKKAYAKVRHVYDRLTDYGVYPGFLGLDSENCYNDGVTFRHGVYQSVIVSSPMGVKYEKMVLDGDTAVSAWIQSHIFEASTDTGARIGKSYLFGVEGLYTALTGRYQHYEKELFYGIGRHHSVANDYTFSLEESSLDLVLGKENIVPTIHGEIGIGISNINVLEGEKKGLHRIDAYPAEQGQGIPGLGGANLLSYGGALMHDTRDNPTAPRAGSYEKIALTMNHGLDEEYDNFAYLKLRAEATRYVPLQAFFPSLQRDKVLVLRGVYERNTDFENNTIPFFDLARLDNKLVRGYDGNRYLDQGILSFTVAYRYTIWRWKDYQTNASLFYDFGWFFEDEAKMRFSDGKDSFGFSLRFIFPNSRVISVEVAHSSEDTECYIKFQPNF